MDLASAQRRSLYFQLIFYVASALSAGGNYLFSSEADYRDWGSVAFFAYIFGAVLLILFLKFKSRTIGRTYKAHFTVAVLVAIGALLIPLSSQVFLETTAGGDHIQPEASIIERSGSDLLHGKPIYITPQKEKGNSLLSPPKPLPVNDYFPYLPGLVPFGIPYSAHVAKQLTDARVYFLIFLIVVSAVSLYFLKLEPSLLLWVFIFFYNAPFLTLALSTGGDDIPVVVMVFASAVALFKRRLTVATILIGLTATLKFTAWPALFFLIIAAKDKNLRPARFKVALGAFIVTLPVLLPVVISEPYGFITNVIRFPLGLAGTPSPASSPLIGKLLTEWFPSIHTEISVMMVLITVIFAIGLCFLIPPRNVANALATTAGTLLVYIILAPTTRYGYFLYPFEFALWSYVFKTTKSQPPSGSSKICKDRSVSEFAL